MTTTTTTLPILHIQHNHGTITLRDVTVEASERENTVNGQVHRYTGRTVTGTPVSGGWTSRLFTATSFREVDKTQPYTQDVWSRLITPLDGKDGEFMVDICTCG